MLSRGSKFSINTQKRLFKNNLRLKFFFITNFKISYKKKKSRHHFCKNFFLSIFFLIYYINKKLKRFRQPTMIYFPKQIKITQPNTTLYNLSGSPAVICRNSPNEFNFKVNTLKKKYIFLSKITNKRFLFKKKALAYNVSFVIFTKFYSHFVVLRAPFRDKISKNILQNQRFFVYLNIQISKKTITTIYNKFFFYSFLLNFQKIIIFKSNILFLHSQKIKIYFYFPGIF